MASKNDRWVEFSYAGKPNFCKPRTEPLECILVGMSRTGTQSLKEAFSLLGYGTIYHSGELIQRNHALFARAGLDAKYRNTGPKFELEQFESMFGDYKVISGEAVTPHAAELIDMYPDAKVILTVRADEERWLTSVLDTMWYSHNHWQTRVLRKLDTLTRDTRIFVDGFWEYMFCYNPKEHAIRKKREHEAMIIRKTPPERLLIYNVKDGWEPLCHFLGKDVPDAPFPHRNEKTQHRQTMATFRKQSFKLVITKLVKRVGVIALICTLLWWLRTRSGLIST